jgi:GNAT superfamily N-acetyltransferase
MDIDVSLVPLSEILPLRELYRREMSCQIVHDSMHQRGVTSSWAIRVDGRIAGYGSLRGLGNEPKETVIEFFVLPVHRPAALRLFRRLIEVSGATRIATQTNDILLTMLFYDFAEKIERDRILFHDARTTSLICPEASFREAVASDAGKTFTHQVEPVGSWLLEVHGEIVATGGVMLHYNVPYGDVYMEVAEAHHRRGYGSFLVQELKRVAYETGHVPAARCDVSNAASRATLEKAGLLPCASMLTGVIRGSAS